MLKYSLFKEGTLVPLSTPPIDKDIDQYDYSSDGDLGDEDSDDLDKFTKRVSDTWDSFMPAFGRSSPPLLAVTCPTVNSSSKEPWKDHPRVGKIINVKDVAYVT